MHTNTSKARGASNSGDGRGVERVRRPELPEVVTCHKPGAGLSSGSAEDWNPQERIRLLRPDIRPGFSFTGRGSRSGSTPIASHRPALRADPQPGEAIRTGFAFIGLGSRINRPAGPSVRLAGRMNPCAERIVSPAVPCKTRGRRLRARGFPFARPPGRMIRPRGRMSEPPEPMRANRGRLLGPAERPAVRQGRGM